MANKEDDEMYRSGWLIVVVLFFSLSDASAAKLCKEYRSCAEVISDFPNGNFGRKDRDKDGIPCENVCRSKQQVQQLLRNLSDTKKSSEKNRVD